MPTPAVAQSITPQTLAELVRCVKRVLITGRREIDVAWLRTYHETGRLINAHLLNRDARAEYGAKVYADLSAATGVSTRTLQECAQVQRCFPIPRNSAQLVWSHFVLLSQVSEPKQREALTTEAERRGWKVTELQQRVRALNAALDIEVETRAVTDPVGDGAGKVAVARLTSKRGTPGLHLIVDRGDGPAVDLGFKLYRLLAPDQRRRFAKGDIVRLGEERITRAEDATRSDLFTYPARVRRVVDGDTLVIGLEIAPAIWLEEKLRLRGLDCPEMSTAAGKAAKRFVEGLIATTVDITIVTSKVDKYDRYLADVYLRRKSGEEIFLNQALLEHGHAVPMEPLTLAGRAAE